MHDDFYRINDKTADLTSIPPDPPHGYRWSENVWISVRQPWIALYQPLNLALFYLHRSVSNFTDESPEYPQLMRELKQEGFLVRIGEHPETAAHQALIDEARRGVFRFICLLPTTRCELMCSYCHQRVPSAQARTMTSDELHRVMVKSAELCTDQSKPVDILFYGGEPLTVFPLVEQLLEMTTPGSNLFRQDVRLSLTTSGIGLDESRANLLGRHQVFVILSVDGSPAVNDTVRRSAGATGAYQAVERACRLLKAAGCRIGLSVTIGTHNIDSLASQVEYLLNRFAIDDIGLNAWLHPVRQGDNPFQVSGETAFISFLEAFEVTQARGVYAEQPYRRLKPFMFRRPLLKDCSSPGERLVLVPGGQIGFCDSCYPAGEYFYDIDDFPDTNHADYQTWRSLSAPEMPSCRVCPAMTVCGGACRYDAYRASGRLDGVQEERCRFERAFLNWMIWELFDHLPTGGQSHVKPTDDQRLALLGSVRLHRDNQPFTAGSYRNTSTGMTGDR